MLAAKTAISSRPETSIVQAGDIGESEPIGNGFEASEPPENVAHYNQSDDAENRSSSPAVARARFASVGGRLSLRCDGLGDARAEMFDEFAKRSVGARFRLHSQR
jgi:hypothetical protein